jgi:hypothetical protein
LWLIAAVGGGWLFGAELDAVDGWKPNAARRNVWAAASVAAGVLGIGMSAAYFVRFRVPLDLSIGLSPATAASDWLASWALLAGGIAIVSLFQTMFRGIARGPKQHGRAWAVLGVGFAAILLFTGLRIAANPWKVKFNTSYAERLLRDANQDSATVYRANLILAQAALDKDDLEGAGRYMVAAGETASFPALAQTGPDTTVARVLLQKGQKEPVVRYLGKFHALWPAGEVVLKRWETAIAAGRQPNFNNRSTDPSQADNGRRN